MLVLVPVQALELEVRLGQAEEQAAGWEAIVKVAWHAARTNCSTPLFQLTAQLQRLS